MLIDIEFAALSGVERHLEREETPSLLNRQQLETQQTSPPTFLPF